MQNLEIWFLSESMTLSGLVICCIVVNYHSKWLKFESCLCKYLTEAPVRTDYHFSEAILIGVYEEWDPSVWLCEELFPVNLWGLALKLVRFKILLEMWWAYTPMWFTVELMCLF